MDKRITMRTIFYSLLIILLISGNAWAQVGESEKSYIRVGELQSHISAYGSERAWTGLPSRIILMKMVCSGHSGPLICQKIMWVILFSR